MNYCEGIVKMISRRPLFAVSGILVVLFAINQTIYVMNRCSSVCHSGVGKVADSDLAERAAIQKLSKMIYHCPKATRYIVDWDYDGTHAFSDVPGSLTYVHRTKTLRHIFEMTGGGLEFINIKDSDIHSAASQNGNLDVLQKQLKQKPIELPMIR